MVTKEDTKTNKKIDLSNNQDEWNKDDEAPVENNDADNEGDNEEEEQTEEVNTKVTYVKEKLNKDRYGNIIIDKLGDYIEPTKTIKNSRQEDLVATKDKFAGILKAASDDEGENSKKPADYSEFLYEQKEVQKKEQKNKKQNKKNVDDGLDDILKEFGVEVKVKEAPVKKEKKVVEKKEIKKEETKEGETKETTTGTTAEPTKEQPKKKVVKTVTKSHLNDAKREILEKQEALKKKQKKQGN